MATFQVTAPDGRILKLTGDSAPTEAELNGIFGAEQELTPLTEQQRAVNQAQVDEQFPETSIGREALKAENINPAIKAGLRAGAKTLVDAGTLGIGGGFVDEAEALARSVVSDRPRAEILEEIRREEANQPTSAKVVGGLARFGSSVLGGGALGKKALGALGSLGGRATAGGITAYGESDGDLVATGLGAGLGAVSPTLAKGTGKLVGKVLPKGVSSKLASKLTTETKGSKNMLSIARSDKLTGTAKGGLEVSKDLAHKSLPLIDREIRNTSGRVQREVLDTFGVKSVKELNEEGRKEFGKFVSKNRNVIVKSPLLKEVFTDDEVGKLASRARILAKRQSPELKGLSDSSIPVLQKTKSILGAMARKGGDNSTSANVLKGQLTDAIESSSAGFKDINKAYAQAISKQQVASKMTALKGNVGRDFAKGLNRVEILDNVSRDFGEDIAEDISTALQRESKISQNLSALKKAAEKTTEIRSGVKKLQQGLSLRNLAGAGIVGGAGATAGLPVAAGLVGSGALLKGGLGAIATKQAGKILPVARQEINTVLQSAIAAAAGRETPNALNKLIGERR